MSNCINDRIIFQDATGGLSAASLDIADQKIHCTFVRDAVTTIVTPVEASETVTIDMVSRLTFFIFFNPSQKNRSNSFSVLVASSS